MKAFIASHPGMALVPARLPGGFETLLPPEAAPERAFQSSSFAPPPPAAHLPCLKPRVSASLASARGPLDAAAEGRPDASTDEAQRREAFRACLEELRPDIARNFAAQPFPRSFRLMFGGSKRDLSWRARFRHALHEVLVGCGLNAGLILPRTYEAFLERACDVFADAFKRIEMRDTLYEDVRDTETFLELAGRAGEIDLWTTGDVQGGMQQVKIVTSDILRLINLGAAEEITRRNDVIANDKIIEIRRTLEAFGQASRREKMLVVVFDDAEDKIVAAERAIEQWAGERPRPYQVHRLLVRARRGKARGKLWEYRCPEADDLRGLIRHIDQAAAAAGVLRREDVIVLLDFDGTLSDNALVRERQRRVFREETARSVERIARDFADAFFDPHSRDDYRDVVTASLTLFTMAEDLEESFGNQEALDADALSRMALLQSIVKIREMFLKNPAAEMAIDFLEERLDAFERTQDDSELAISDAVSLLRDALLFGAIRAQRVPAARRAMARALIALRYDEAAEELLEDLAREDNSLLGDFFTCCAGNGHHARVVDFVREHELGQSELPADAGVTVAIAHILAARSEADNERRLSLLAQGWDRFEATMAMVDRSHVSSEHIVSHLHRELFAQALAMHDFNKELDPMTAAVWNERKLIAIARAWNGYERLVEREPRLIHAIPDIASRYIGSAVLALRTVVGIEDPRLAEQLAPRVRKLWRFARGIELPAQDRRAVDDVVLRFLDWHGTSFSPHGSRTRLAEALAHRPAVSAINTAWFVRAYQDAVHAGDLARAFATACKRSYGRLIHALIDEHLLGRPLSLKGMRIVDASGVRHEATLAAFEGALREHATETEPPSLTQLIEPYRMLLEAEQRRHLPIIRALAPRGAIVESRAKSAASLLLKMLREGKDRLPLVTDGIGFRVLTDSEDEMRATYERVREQLHPEERKEWITHGAPTKYRYQSMDITGRHRSTGVRIQVQVRTKALDAAIFFEPSNVHHYKYRSGVELWEAVEGDPEGSLALMGRILENLEGAYQELALKPNARPSEVVEAFARSYPREVFLWVLNA